MTKYVINSGGIFKGGDLGHAFFAEMLEGLGDRPKVLFCFFASPREEWGVKLSQYVKGFKAVLPDGTKPTFELALPEAFTEQIATCDVLYMHGGDNHLILSALHRYDIPNIWQGKVVATNSASSIALAVHSWSCDQRCCIDGLGVLPIKVIPHYQSDYGSNNSSGPIDWQKAYDELAAYGDTSLAIHALKEGEFIVITNLDDHLRLR